MITAAAFCPCAPVLVTDLAVGAAPELDALRAAASTAITQAAHRASRLVLVGPGDVTAVWGPHAIGTLAGYGLEVPVALHPPGAGRAGEPGGVRLSPELAVGAWLLSHAGARAEAAIAIASSEDATADGALHELVADARPTSLVVVGDGSVRRSIDGPGSPDAPAVSFDEGVAAALRAGDPRGLAGLDAVLGRRLLSAGTPVWRSLGRALGARTFCGELSYAEAPYGVGYFVAAWHTPEPAP